MLERSRLRAKTGVLCVAVAALAGVVVAATAIASGCRHPTIVGDPVVGNVLSVTFTAEGTDTSTSTGEFDGLYRWQSCDPAVADCFASTSHQDPNWSDLPAPDGDPHSVQSELMAGHAARAAEAAATS